MRTLLVTHWETIFLFFVVVGIALVLYRRYIIGYEFIYFAGKAHRLALVKTGVMVSLLLGAFAGAEWLFAWLLPAGYLQIVLSFVVPYLLLKLIWQPMEVWLDRLFYG